MMSSHDSQYVGDIATVTMVTAIRQVVRRRITLCQHMIVMFHLYKLVSNLLCMLVTVYASNLLYMLVIY